jgi:hypothetical protein
MVTVALQARSREEASMIRLRTASLIASIRRYRPCVLAWVTVMAALTLPAAHAQQPFAQLFAPTGVATDLAGNVFVISDAVTTTQLTKFAPNVTPLAAVGLGGITVGVFTNSRLALDSGTGFLLMLTPQGVVYAIHPDTLQAQPVLDLHGLPPTEDAVFDVLTGTVRPLVLGVPPHYQDLAVRRLDSARVDLFISASTGASGGFPFVLRVRFVGQNPPVADAIVFSSGTSAGAVEGRAGVAVNNQGLVVTTMAAPTPAGFTNSLVAFGADFPENPTVPPQFPLRGSNGAPLDFTSAGMTSDPAGNFYVATGVVGLSECGAGGSGALVFLSAALDTLVCVPPGLVLVRTEDVAVSPGGEALYLTDFSGNLVVRFP